MKFKMAGLISPPRAYFLTNHNYLVKGKLPEFPVFRHYDD